MSGRERDILQARERAMAARARLADTMSEVQDRLHPRALLNEAWQEVRERGQEFAEEAVNIARTKPMAVSAIVAAAIALFAREPICQALASLFGRRRETADGGTELTSQAAPPSSAEGETARQYEEIA